MIGYMKILKIDLKIKEVCKVIMKSNRRALLDEISEYHFACVELNLYLDNNPNDKNALNLYNSYIEKYMQAKRDYKNRYGSDSYPWSWDNEFYK